MDAIILRGVRTHNLKNFDLVLPHRRLYVVTGVSGSGKSSLSFDTLYAEGQRRYVESLSSYARQFLERMEKPDVDAVSGIPPAIAIEAKNAVTNARSTVGTQTEVNDYLRVFFARAGKTGCCRCGKPVERQTPEKVFQRLAAEHPSSKALLLFPLRVAGLSAAALKQFLPELSRQGFTEIFDKGKVISIGSLRGSNPNEGRLPAGRQEAISELPDCFDRLRRSRNDESKVENLWIVADRLVIDPKHRKRWIESLETASRMGKGEGSVYLEEKKKHFYFSERFRCDPCGIDYRDPVPNLFSFNNPLGACPACQGFGRVITLDWDRVIPDVRKSVEEGAIEPWTKPSAHEELKGLLNFCKRARIPLKTPWKDLSEEQRRWILEGRGKGAEDYFSVKDYFEFLETKTYKMHVRIFLSRYRGYVPCGDCRGDRLKPEALAVRVAGRNIAEISKLPVDALLNFFEELKLAPEELEKAEPVLLEIRKRVRFLKEVGLTYLTLDRLSRTLSGGEVERIHLAGSLGSGLVDTLYVLDEPSIGLHERDNALLIRLLKELRDLGNTVVVVEHDRAMIEAADEVIDMGPQGGEKGGHLIFQGQVKDLAAETSSWTGNYLAGRLEIGWKKPRKNLPSGKSIQIRGASRHNLRSVDVDIPLNRFVVVTGVSGSGKSTLIYDILYQNYLRGCGRPVQDIGRVKSVKGLDRVHEIVLVDQTPIGRTPRSNPVTYLQAFDDVRRAFGTSEEAKRRGLTFRDFSFNAEGGRCETCKGDGRIKVEMHFLADVFLPCEACGGKRFRPEILEVRYQGHSIDQVLEMTVDEALEFFDGRPAFKTKMSPLQKVGLSYLRLGQAAPTLSGGEAQRLKLAREIAAGDDSRRILYLFDEPTTGLHYRDVSFLMGAFEELLERGHSVLVIEHNMEVIRCADWVLDLGPEGGSGGGQIVYAGGLPGLLACKASHTGNYLGRYLALSAGKR